MDTILGTYPSGLNRAIFLFVMVRCSIGHTYYALLFMCNCIGNFLQLSLLLTNNTPLIHVTYRSPTYIVTEPVTHYSQANLTG